MVYRVLFPIQNPTPVLIDLRVNGRSICQGYPAHGRINTNIKLFHTLNTRQGATQSWLPPVQYHQTPPDDNRYDSVDVPTSFNNDICGQTYERAVGLVSGHSYRRGGWPWLVALYFRGEFICGGTLGTVHYTQNN